MSVKKYDFVFSIGEACSCTQVLRQQGLQNASYPFDWLFGSTLVKRCEILANEFKDRQIIILTCTNREKDILKQLPKSYSDFLYKEKSELETEIKKINSKYFK